MSLAASPLGKARPGMGDLSISRQVVEPGPWPSPDQEGAIDLHRDHARSEATREAVGHVDQRQVVSDLPGFPWKITEASNTAPSALLRSSRPSPRSAARTMPRGVLVAPEGSRSLLMVDPPTCLEVCLERHALPFVFGPGCCHTL